MKLSNIFPLLATIGWIVLQAWGLLSEPKGVHYQVPLYWLTITAGVVLLILGLLSYRQLSDSTKNQKYNKVANVLNIVCLIFSMSLFLYYVAKVT